MLTQIIHDWKFLHMQFFHIFLLMPLHYNEHLLISLTWDTHLEFQVQQSVKAEPLRYHACVTLVLLSYEYIIQCKKDICPIVCIGKIHVWVLKGHMCHVLYTCTWEKAKSINTANQQWPPSESQSAIAPNDLWINYLAGMHSILSHLGIYCFNNHCCFAVTYIGTFYSS